MTSNAVEDTAANASKDEPERSEKYLLGEKMVVEFLGKPYQLGVCAPVSRKFKHDY